MRLPQIALSEIAEINPKGPSKNELTPNELVDFVPMAFVSETGTMQPDGQRPYAEVSKGYTAFKDKDVLLAKITPCFENNKIAQASVATPYAFGSTEFHVIRRDGECLDEGYLTHFLRQDYIRKAGERRMTGSGGQRRVPKAFLEDLKIPLPPLEEQKRIARILDQADALRRLRTRALDKLNTLGQAIFHEMFGEGAADGENWPRYALADLVLDDDRINYGVVQPGDHDADGVPIIRVADLAASIIDFDTVKRISKDIDANYARSRLKGGEVLIGCVGSIGTAMIAPEEFKGANIARAVARVAVDPKKCDPEFVAEYIRSDLVQQYFQKEVRLVAQPTLNIKQIRETEIFVPPAELQEKFLERLNVIKESKGRAARGFVNQETLFASLQHRAFRGEL